MVCSSSEIKSNLRHSWCEACAVQAGFQFEQLFEAGPAGQVQQLWLCPHCDPTKTCTPSCSSVSHRPAQAQPVFVEVPAHRYHTAAPAPAPVIASLAEQLAAARRGCSSAASSTAPLATRRQRRRWGARLMNCTAQRGAPGDTLGRHCVQHTGVVLRLLTVLLAQLSNLSGAQVWVDTRQAEQADSS